MKRPLKPIVLTKRQIDNALEKLFNISGARAAMSWPVYDYAWTIWAKRRDIKSLQGERAARMAKRETRIEP